MLFSFSNTEVHRRVEWMGSLAQLGARILQIKSYIDFLKKSPAPWLILRLQQVLLRTPPSARWLRACVGLSAG